MESPTNERDRLLAHNPEHPTYNPILAQKMIMERHDTHIDLLSEDLKAIKKMSLDMRD